MIAKVMAKGFKGLEFEQPLSRLNLFVGPNGAGKSARAETAVLAVNGCLPGGPKQPGALLDAYGSAEKMFVGVELSDHTHLMRRYVRGESGGGTSQVMKDRKKCTPAEYAKALAGITVFDLRGFLSLSDQEKQDMIFSLFPPDGDIRELDGKIEALKAKRDKIAADIRAIEGTIKRLAGARAQIQLPAGSLSELTEQIAGVEKELAEARENLKDQEIAEAEARAADAARAQARLEAEQAMDAAAKVPPSAVSGEPAFLPESPGFPERPPVVPAAVRDPIPGVDYQTSYTAGGILDPIGNSDDGHDPVESIQSIIATMRNAGCDACAAVLVAKRELRKHARKAVA